MNEQTTPDVIRPISRFKISDSVAAEIERMIKAGVYKLGDKLPSERVLSEELGVGRSSMREALRILEGRGLVSIAHGLGVFVTERPVEVVGSGRDLLLLGECTVPELFEVRRALECTAASLAARRVTPQDAAHLDEILAFFKDGSLSDAEYIERDAELHTAIVRASRNNLLIRLHESIEHLFFEYSARVIQLPGRRTTAASGHAEIVDAIVKRRPQVAQKAMSAHLDAVERDINDYLDVASARN